MAQRDTNYDQAENPSPADFENYLPWACGHMALDETVLVVRYDEGKRDISQAKGRGSKVTNKEEESYLRETETNIGLPIFVGYGVVHIDAFYDSAENLVHIRFSKNKYVSPNVLKMITLIARFYPRLTTITIDDGLDQQSLHELNKLVKASNITEVILDKNEIPQANYYILLDFPSSISYLSLSRCNLNDKVIEILVSKLSISSHLFMLNLCSNKITDEGAKLLGHLLRSNRTIRYLNLADNLITDEGASSILGSLMEFRLNTDEICQKRKRYFTFLKDNDTISDTEVEPVVSEPTTLTKRSIGGKKTKNADLIHKIEDDERIINTFTDAFQSENVFVENGDTYCFGNNVLCYLNLAYNDLGYFTVKKLHTVFKVQEDLKRQPRGLINVRIEGNNIPNKCMELTDIGVMIEGIINAHTQTLGKKSKSNR